MDERILDAAERVFLDRGFEGATIDEIAAVARAGKPTIYARHAGKQELFTAVILRNIGRTLQATEASSQGETAEEQLQALGLSILRGVMSDASIGLFRITLSESRRFPDLAAQVSRLGRERGIDAVARVLDEVSRRQGRRLHADDLYAVARIFMDLIVLPVIMRRLFGETVEALEGELSRHVADRVTVFVAACCTRGESVTPNPLGRRTRDA